MKTVPVIHRGRVDAAAFLVDVAMLGEAEAQRRIVRLWQPGSRVLRIAAGYLVTVAPPRDIHSDRALGAPLTLDGHQLVSAPGLQSTRGDVVLLRHGIVQALDFEDAKTVDISAWIDTAPFAVIDTEPLGEPPPEPTFTTRPPESVRAVLGDKIPPPAEALESFRASMIPKSDAAGGASTQSATPSPPGFWERAMHTLRRWFGGADERETDTSDPSSPSKKSGRFARWFDRWTAKFMHMSRLSRLLGRRQAEYMRRLLDMLEDNAIDDVLRHAIPLSDDATGAPSQPSWGLPSARDELVISGGAQTSRSMMSVGGDLFEHLRQRYRRVFERLVQEGRIDEAAFVLAELLNESEEAVAFLERQGQLKKAAELAEGRRLEPGLVVRQWIIASDWTRALRIARRHHAFGDALLRLEDQDRDTEKALRLMWADALAEAGNFIGAVDTVWPIEEARQLAAPWIDAALTLGGPGAAKMMVRALTLRPAAFETLGPKIKSLLDDDDGQTIDTRHAFMDALGHAEPNAELRAVARPAIRALYRDAAQHGAPTHRDRLSRLLRIADDPTLRADLPAIPRATPSNTSDEPTALTIDEADAGTVAIHDAALLPSGRFLVAVGEAGTLHLTRDGRVVKHYDQPTHHLVVSDGGHRAIAIGRRGDAFRLARLDLVHQRSSSWCEAALTTYASTFDGWHWFVGTVPDGALTAIDAADRGWTSVWRNADCRPASIARGPDVLSVSSRDTNEHFETWRFDLPSLVLRRRRDVAADLVRARTGTTAVTAGYGPIDADTNAAVFEYEEHTNSVDPDTTVVSQLWLRASTGAMRPVVLDCAPPLRLAIGGGARRAAFPASGVRRDRRSRARYRLADVAQRGLWCAFAEILPMKIVVHVVDTQRRAVRLTLNGARTCTLRFVDDRFLVIADDRGRLLLLDYPRRVLQRSLRVSA